ncbi:MAG: hypothetical protein AB1508_12700 [Pseudomonadota bacterium]
MTQREFAKLKGVSERTINVWIHKGYAIKDESSGLIDVAASNASLAANHPGGGVPVEFLREPSTHPSLVTVHKDWLAEALDGLIDTVVAAMNEAWKSKEHLVPREVASILAKEVEAIMAALE